MINVLLILVFVVLAYLTMRSLKTPGIALGVIWSMYGLEQFLQYANRFFITRGALVNYAVVILVVVSLTLAFMRRDLKRIPFSNSHLWFAGLMALSALSLIWSIYSKATDVFISHIPYILSFAVLAPICAFESKQVEKAINTTVYYGLVVLAGLFFCSFGQRSIVLDVVNGKEILGSPLAVASYGGFVAICAIFSFFKNRTNLLTSTLKIVAALLGIYLIIRSGARGQLIFMVLAIFIWMPITAGMMFKRSNLLLLLIAAIVLLTGISWIQDVGMVRRWDMDIMTRDGSSRFEAAKFILESNYRDGIVAMVFGLGSSASYRIVGIYPHVVPAEVLAEEGLVGLILFTGFLGISAFKGWQVLRAKRIPINARFDMGALLTLFTFQFGLCLKQGSLLGSPLLFCFGLCIAVWARQLNPATSRAKPIAVAWQALPTPR